MGALEPLKCSTCHAPVPLGEGDEVVCPSCDARQPLPAPYRELREARRLSAEDARALDGLVADVSRPPPAWKRVAVVVGYGVGITTLVIFAIGLIVGVVVGFLGAAKVELGETVGMIIIALCATVFGLVSVPFVGELLVVSVQNGDWDLGVQVASGAVPRLDIDIAVGVVLYLFSVVPIAIAWRTQMSLKKVEELKLRLAAAPAVNGARGCRACGAPLDVPAGALAARCVYCSTDNLVSVEGRVAEKQKARARQVHLGVKEVLAEHARLAREDRRTMWQLLLAGPLLTPVVCLGGVLLHVIAS